MPARCIGFLCLLLLSAAPLSAQPSAPQTSEPRVNCQPVTDTPSAGDKALAGRSYQEALAFFQEARKNSPDSDEAHLGLIEAMLGLNNLKGALEESNAWRSKAPDNALANVAMADTLYRSAHFSEAVTLLAKQMPAHLCEARLHARYGRIAEDNALYATAWKQFEIAHLLRPNDEIILRQWINTLPRKRRLEELEKYLSGAHDLSADQSVNYTAEENHLKAHRVDECRVTSKAEATTVPFKPIYRTGTLNLFAYGLDVSFNGKKRRMQIDSGASGILLTADAAKGLNLQREQSVRTGGVGDKGTVDSFITHVEHITIGDVEVSNCMVEVLGKSSLNVDGLIGPDVFDRWLVTLDYPGTKLSLERLPPRPDEPAPRSLNSLAEGSPEGEDTDYKPHDRYIAPQMTDWLRVVRIGHTILLPARIGKAAEQRYLIADTGASLSLLSVPAAQAAGRIEPSELRISGISGEVKKSYWSDSIPIIFGHFSLPPVRYGAIDLSVLSNHMDTEISGFVGLPTLSRLTITIDYRDNLLKMTYDPKHDPHQF